MAGEPGVPKQNGQRGNLGDLSAHIPLSPSICHLLETQSCIPAEPHTKADTLPILVTPKKKKNGKTSALLPEREFPEAKGNRQLNFS